MSALALTPQRNRARKTDSDSRMNVSVWLHQLLSKSLGIEDALVPLHSLAANWTKYINK